MFQQNTKLYLSSHWDQLCFPMPTLVIAEILHPAIQSQSDALEPMLEEQELMVLKLSKSLRMLMQVTKRLSVSNVQMQVEVQSSMITGLSNKPEIAKQLFMEKPKQLFTQLSRLSLTLLLICMWLQPLVPFSSPTLII
jgi:hypothetical protein